ncbi:MAG TPA: glycosyltransferase family 2 protein [Bryobacteraceae bacterium]
MNDGNPFSLSIIVPAYNASSTLSRCLDSVFKQAGPEIDVLVVDDCSSDNTREIASGYPVRLLEMDKGRGPGAARNRGATDARAPVLFFIDADVTLGERALARARADIAAPGVDAVIGSYDDDPGAPSTVSQFKNLAHHYFHQHSDPDATTFWGACGLIKRELFLSVGGFSEEINALEDVDLGYRLSARGACIKLDPELQVKHLKHWTLAQLLRTDFGLRALPWAHLLMKYGYLPRGLNFRRSQQAATLLAMLLVVFGAATIFRPAAAVPFVLCIALAAAVNRGLYELFFRKGGLRLLVGGFLLQQLYYLYSVCGLVVGIALSRLGKRRFSSVRS